MITGFFDHQSMDESNQCLRVFHRDRSQVKTTNVDCVHAARHDQSCPNIPRLARGDFCWSGGCTTALKSSPKLKD